uniref:Uncharacterized protein n=1 Tax=Romanomermis culicivorax TaxID=13658 RepID=A0A915L207_ROMCU
MKKVTERGSNIHRESSKEERKNNVKKELENRKEKCQENFILQNEIFKIIAKTDRFIYAEFIFGHQIR